MDVQARNKSGWTLLEYLKISEEEITTHDVTGAFAVLTVSGLYLIGFHHWRKQWEFPAGGIEPGETARQAAAQELLEETLQKASDFVFKGLFRAKKPNGMYVYQAVSLCEQDECLLFERAGHDEMEHIMLWDLKQDIGYVDACDLKMVELSCL
ncbi:MAG: NUDIX hydrolase [Oscillospiraceae bacterium]